MWFDSPKLNLNEENQVVQQNSSVCQKYIIGLPKTLILGHQKGYSYYNDLVKRLCLCDSQDQNWKAQEAD